MGLLNKRNIKNIDILIRNKYNITEKDMIRELKGFPISIAVKMLEEQEKQGINPNVTAFQENKQAGTFDHGFGWAVTEDGYNFWYDIINYMRFDLFYERYPEYKKYDC